MLYIATLLSRRYYDPLALTGSSNIAVVKVACDGHDGPPTPEQTKAFVDACDVFWAEHPDKAIGVHCTHGFNRTGYMICSYLEQSDLGIAVEDTIYKFQRSRPPGIYKPAYVRGLLEAAGDPEVRQLRLFFSFFSFYFLSALYHPARAA